MRPPTLLPNLSNPPRVSASIETLDTSASATTRHPYLTDTNTGTLCEGPLGPCIVLPVATGYPCEGPFVATSMCNGTDLPSLWWWNNTIISTSPSTVTYASWIYVAENRTIYAVRNLSVSTPTQVQGIVFTPPKARGRITAAEIRAGRRAVRRSIDIYSRFRGLEELRRFIRGDAIVYEGEQYNYHVRKTMKVLQHTMNPGSYLHPYTFFAADKKTDKEVARGCISIAGIPVIDQLLALSFYIQDPKDEQDLIRTVNWTPHLPKSRARPVIQEAA